jgi:hypothetical protein
MRAARNTCRHVGSLKRLSVVDRRRLRIASDLLIEVTKHILAWESAHGSDPLAVHWSAMSKGCLYMVMSALAKALKPRKKGGSHNAGS